MISMMKNFPCIRSMLLCRMHPLNLEEREPSHGWLENESIWLHMEYKYLLELIRNGMYEAFLRISTKLRSHFWIRKYMEEVFMRIHPLSQAVKIQTKHITAKVLWHA